MSTDDVAAQAIYLAEEAADAAFNEPISTAATSETARALKLLVTAAGETKDKADRDNSLLSALRSCRTELEDAKRESDAAAKRLEEIKNVYNLAARVLSGYTPLEERMSNKQKSRRETMESGTTKRVKVKRDSTSSIDGAVDIMIDDVKEEPVDVPLPTNPITMPTPHTTSLNMPTEVVEEHREAFYQKLLNCSVADLSTYIPSANSANLKTKAQLAEWIYIAQNWNTGADGLDAGAFRAKYKTWYSRMKPVTVNLGRRTGIHLRQYDEGGESLTVLCRHSKDGSRSLPYLPIDLLFDALFEIHAVELGHRGRDATKNVADERYANIPDTQVRHFIESCPVCLGRKRGNEMHIESI